MRSRILCTGSPAFRQATLVRVGIAHQQRMPGEEQASHLPEAEAAIDLALLTLVADRPAELEHITEQPINLPASSPFPPSCPGVADDPTNHRPPPAGGCHHGRDGYTDDDTRDDLHASGVRLFAPEAVVVGVEAVGVGPVTV
jgi:hypothetical protein